MSGSPEATTRGGPRSSIPLSSNRSWTSSLNLRVQGPPWNWPSEPAASRSHSSRRGVPVHGVELSPAMAAEMRKKPARTTQVEDPARPPSAQHLEDPTVRADFARSELVLLVEGDSAAVTKSDLLEPIGDHIPECTGSRHAASLRRIPSPPSSSTYISVMRNPPSLSWISVCLSKPNPSEFRSNRTISRARTENPREPDGKSVRCIPSAAF